MGSCYVVADLFTANVYLKRTKPYVDKPYANVDNPNKCQNESESLYTVLYVKLFITLI